jgi:hypothetical protein
MTTEIGNSILKEVKEIPPEAVPVLSRGFLMGAFFSEMDMYSTQRAKNSISERQWVPIAGGRLFYFSVCFD